MEVPNLVREHLGDEAVESTVSLGDEDVVCVTPTRALVYRGEGLLSDESVEAYPLDVERFDVSEGRRKTKFVFDAVDGTESFAAPASRAESLLSLLLQGILRVEDVIDGSESVAGVYQFSELTLIVAESRLVKHVGATVWDDDFEVFDYDDVAGLEFEEGSVATQIVITVDGRPQRIKAPNEAAPQVEQTLVQALCAYYDVRSLEGLQEVLADNSEELVDERETSPANDLELDDGISPLVGDDQDANADEGTAEAPAADQDAPDEAAAWPSDRDGHEETDSETPPASDSWIGTQTTADATSDSEPDSVQSDPGSPADATDRSGTAASSQAVDPDDVAKIKEQLSTLTAAVKRQNEILERHDARIEDHDARIEQLIDELRRGR